MAVMTDSGDAVDSGTTRWGQRGKRSAIASGLRKFNLYCVLCFTVFFIATGRILAFDAWGTRVSVGKKLEQFVIFSLLLSLITIAMERKNHLKFTVREVLLCSFIAWSLLSLVYSPFSSDVLDALARFAVAGAFYFVLMETLREEKGFKVLVLALIVGSVVVSLRAMKEFLFEGKNTLSSSWGHKNYLGFFLVMPASLLTAFVFFSRFGKAVRILGSVVLTVVVAGMAAVFSRGALLSLPVSFAVYCLIAGYKRLLVWCSAMAVAVIVVVLTVFGSGGIEAAAKTGDPLLHGRVTDIWPNALLFIAERPVLGAGLDSYGAVYCEKRGLKRPDFSLIQDKEQRRRAKREYATYEVRIHVHAHNELLQLWVGLGVSGVFFYFAVSYLVVRTFLRNRARVLSRFLGSVNVGVFIWFIARGVHGCFDYFYLLDRSLLASALMLALIFKINDLPEERLPDSVVGQCDNSNL